MCTRQSSACLASMALLLFLASPLRADPTPAELLVGGWEWVSAQDAWTGEVYTPATEGFTRQIQFFADGTATWFQDGTALWSTTWEFRAIGVNPFALLVCGGAGYFCEVTANSLRMDQRYVDGPLWIYTRREPVSLETMSWGAVKALFD